MACMGKRRGAYRDLVVKPEGRRKLERSRCRWEKNIIVGLKEVEWEGTNWIDVAQVRVRWRVVVNVVMKFQVP